MKFNFLPISNTSPKIILYIEYEEFIIYFQIFATNETIENDSLALKYIANLAIPVHMNIIDNGIQVKK